ncbi:MAG: hypothetical protein A2297_04515 [Elusimicrobia bacterium RIFOXYB2_FULL_48_7]|nr:MAG: hypothetical protein A2297_04515 [Elusimicrobia bacterium RIFOXYB2_FULL_48_7]
MNCKICGRESARLRKEITADSGKRYDVYRCPACRLVFVDPMPSEQEIEQGGVYGEKYYDGIFNREKDYFSETVMECERKVVEAQHNFIKGLLIGRDYLDIGCGDGKMLSLMRDKGWRGTGVEISRVSAEYGIKNRGADIKIGSIFSQELKDVFEDGSFDFITLRHVIEHLVDPVKLVKTAAGLLKKGGIIRIDTDNCEGLLNSFVMRGLIGGKNKNSLGKLLPPVHIYYFSPKNMRILLESNGFEVIKMICPPQGAVEYFPKPNKYAGSINERIKQLIDDIGGLFNKGEVLVVYALK